MNMGHALPPLEIGVPGQMMPPAARAVELARKNERAGFDALWWPSHLMGWHPDSIWTQDMTPLAAVQPNPHLYYDPMTMMAAVGSQTERIRVGVVVADLVMRHPAAAAQTILTVDHLTAGRAIIGLGSGERMNLTPYGAPGSHGVARLAEGIEVMRLLWQADGPVSYEGTFHRLDRAVLGLMPFDATPPIWVAAHGPRMLELTGRLADGWLPTKIPVEAYRDGLAAIGQSAVDAGRERDRFTAGMLGYVLLAPDEDTLERLAAQPLVRYLCVMLPPELFRSMGLEPPMAGSGFHHAIPASIERAEALRIIEAIPPRVVRDYAFCGTPEQVAEQLDPYRRAGLRHLIAWNITPFGAPELAGWSFSALGELRRLLTEEAG